MRRTWLLGSFPGAICPVTHWSLNWCEINRIDLVEDCRKMGREMVGNRRRHFVPEAVNVARDTPADERPNDAIKLFGVDQRLFLRS